MFDSSQLPIILAMVLILAGGIHDVLTLRIPNLIVLALFLLFWPAAFFSGMGWGAIALHALTFAGVLAAGYAAYRYGALGAGDAKFLAACALWTGARDLPLPLVAMAVLGGGLSLMVRFAGPMLPPSAHATVLGRMVAESRVPYGAAIAGGFLLWFVSNPVLARLS